jgi:hypothetical protein
MKSGGMITVHRGYVSEGWEGRNLMKGVPYKGDRPRNGRWVGWGLSLGGSTCYTNPETNEGIATTYIYIYIYT